MPNIHHLRNCGARLGNGICTCETRGYAFVLGIAVSICLLQLAGSWLANSISLFSDTMHVGSDAASDLISLLVARTIARGTFSAHREDAFRLRWMRISNGLLLLTLPFIGYESWERFQHPSPVAGWTTMTIAGAGLLLNLWRHRLVPHKHTHTGYGAAWHIVVDMVSAVAVIASGILIGLTHQYLIDPVISLGIIVWIGYNTIRMMLYGAREQ